MKPESDDIFLSSIGQIIKELRKKHKFTQTDLCQKVSINDRYYQDIEYGKRNLSAKVLSKILKVYEIDLLKYLEEHCNNKID